jgi:hypothetical protein
VSVPDQTIEGRLDDRRVVFTVYDNEVTDRSLQI